MKNKCIKNVYNNDKDKLQNTEAMDIKKDIADKYNFFTNLFKKMI